jgi:RNA polymerase sigma factor (sigma-70 family)
MDRGVHRTKWLSQQVNEMNSNERQHIADGDPDHTGDTLVAMQDLLDNLRRGDDIQAVKDQLISRAYLRLQHLAHRMLNGYDRQKLDEETNGLVAEAYLRLNRSIDDLKPETVRQFFGLAALQMRRHLLDKLRAIHGRGEMKRPKVTSLSPESSDASAIQPGILDAGVQSDGTAIDVLESLDKLDERQRECLVLQHWYGLNHQEIASLLGVSTKTVQRTTNLAFIQLNELLKSYSPNENQSESEGS